MKEPTKNPPSVSLIVPLFNEQENVSWLNEQVELFFQEKSISGEIIYVNDGSTDDSLSVIKSLSAKNPSIRYISFSRNFGKEAATTAGLKKAKGDIAIIMDADGQHPIELVDEFIKYWEDGYLVVVGVRESNQGEGAVKSLGSKLFYALLRFLGSNDSAQTGLTDFRLLDRKVIDEYNRLTEHNRVTRNLIDWLGFKRKLVPFHARARHAGKAAYSFRKLTKLAVDGIVKHSTRPLKLIGLIGVLISVVSLSVAIAFLIEMYTLGDPLGWGVTGTAILALFLSFMVGIVLVCQGLLALYLENVYFETQNRPLYVVEEER